MTRVPAELYAEDINVRDDEGNTALHRAARDDDGAAALALLRAGADPTLMDSRNTTPLGVAMFEESVQVVDAFRNFYATTDNEATLLRLLDQRQRVMTNRGVVTIFGFEMPATIFGFAVPEFLINHRLPDEPGMSFDEIADSHANPLFGMHLHDIKTQISDRLAAEMQRRREAEETESDVSSVTDSENESPDAAARAANARAVIGGRGGAGRGE